ncbi:MAG: hypothetical protein IKE22_04370 [Atopobiaceae bacterium]|nr:hypothetical protein [Atopobiaceae bacterium]
MRKATQKTTKVLALAMTFALAAAPLAGCKGKGGDGGTSEAKPQETVVEATEDTTEQQAETDVYVIKKATYSYALPDGENYEEVVDYTIDDHGNTVKLSSQYVNEETTFDENGFETQIVSKYEMGDDVTTTYTYERDDAGRVVKRTDNTGGVKIWEYDENGKVSKITTTWMVSDINGEGESVDLGMMQRTTTYDTNGFPIRIEDQWPDSDPSTTEYEFELGDNGLPSLATITVNYGDEVMTYTQTYEYDAAGNIVKQTSDGDTSEVITYEWAKIDDPSEGARLNYQIKQ